MSNKPICNVDTPDPWMIKRNNLYYLMFTLGNRLEVWASQDMQNFNHAQKSLIWRPDGSGWEPGVWAPELHYLGGAWYVYFSAAKEGGGPASHRTLVLQSQSQDPMDAGAWRFAGPLRGVPDHWAIDCTVFSPDNTNLYCCWSGWPLGDNSDTEQDLFIAKLASPLEAVPNSVTVISRPTASWERPDGGRRGVNEGPTWLCTPEVCGIVFSAHGSWTCDYKLGILYYTGGDPLNPSSWSKRSTPLLRSDRGKGPPFGPGHASFLAVEGRLYCIYHATGKITDGWKDRKARVLELSPEFLKPGGSCCCCATGHSGRSPEEFFHHMGGKIRNKLRSL
ncbi:hypothetical protein MSPP1_003037 [Malassezia sp. CBS 17886]|nr:hypothetical protein MSPP1_003037 [Malassezia sp. CBS 17886]